MESFKLKETINIAEYLRGYGLRPSPQRIGVMQYLIDHPIHPTVETIYESLSPHYPTLSRTTVYNTLATLRSAGAILELSLDKATSHYDGCIKPHAHFFCTRCGKVEDIWFEEGDFIERYKPQGAQVEAAELSYRGVCEACQKIDIQ